MLVIFTWFSTVQHCVSQIVINEFMSYNFSSNLDTTYSAYSDWIEIHNNSDKSVDISGYYLSDSYKAPKKWQIPSNTVLTRNSYLLIWADKQNQGYHTNFSLKNETEEIILSDGSLEVIDSIHYSNQVINCSYGRTGNTNKDWAHFTLSTSGTENSTNFLLTTTK